VYNFINFLINAFFKLCASTIYLLYSKFHFLDREMFAYCRFIFTNSKLYLCFPTKW